MGTSVSADLTVWMWFIVSKHCKGNQCAWCYPHPLNYIQFITLTMQITPFGSKLMNAHNSFGHNAVCKYSVLSGDVIIRKRLKPYTLCLLIDLNNHSDQAVSLLEKSCRTCFFIHFSVIVSYRLLFKKRLLACWKNVYLFPYCSIFLRPER